jgi:hypothetical protein
MRRGEVTPTPALTEPQGASESELADSLNAEIQGMNPKQCMDAMKSFDELLEEVYPGYMPAENSMNGAAK